MGAEGNKSKGEYMGMKGFVGSRFVELHITKFVGPTNCEFFEILN